MKSRFDKHICWEWAQIGSAQGLGRSIMLAYGYMSLPILIAIAGFLWQVGTDINALFTGGELRLLSEPMALMGALVVGVIFCVFYMGFGTVLGVLPAVILGTLSGSIIGAVLSLPHIEPYRWNRLAVGIGIGLVIAALVNQVGMWMFLNQGEEGMGAYFFFIMGPSLFYLGFCAWLSDQLPTLVAKHQHPREFPVRIILIQPYLSSEVLIDRSYYQQHERPVLPMELKETGKGG